MLVSCPLAEEQRPYPRTPLGYSPAPSAHNNERHRGEGVSDDGPNEGQENGRRMFAMRDPSASRVDTSRIHRLLRALVGVADVSIIVTPQGKLRSVAVLRDGNVQEHQLVRNVVSGLKAGFGLRLDANDVQVILHADAWRQRAAAEAERRGGAETAPSQPAPASPAPSLPAPPAVTRPHIKSAGYTNGNGKPSNGKSNGNSHASGNGN